MKRRSLYWNGAQIIMLMETQLAYGCFVTYFYNCWVDNLLKHSMIFPVGQQHQFREWLGAEQVQPIIWTIDVMIYWRVYANMIWVEIDDGYPLAICHIIPGANYFEEASASIYHQLNDNYEKDIATPRNAFQDLTNGSEALPRSIT